jgi:ATP-binding cassette subfamily B protein
MLPQLWLILGLAGSTSVFILQPLSVGALAVMLGGVLLAEQALSAIASQIAFFIPLSLAWRQVRPLLRAARTQEDGSVASTFTLENSRRAEQSDPRSETHSQSSSQTPLLALRDVAFRYRERARAALEDVTLQIFPSDRILVQGPSGGGKSTLAAILAGLRVPEAGLLLLRGYDRVSVGTEEWRQRVVIAPQFHENHVFAETFAFNLLMGRRWPPSSEDEREAYEICDELGLSPLLARMPSGLHQIVGENGWQLSHGERSRLFIARALLQRSELIILDESFAALDPENLARALRCVLKRAPTLLVIAHP